MKLNNHNTRKHNLHYLRIFFACSFSFPSTRIQEYSVRRYLAYLQCAKPLPDSQCLQHIADVCGLLSDPEAEKLVHLLNSIAESIVKTLE